MINAHASTHTSCIIHVVSVFKHLTAAAAAAPPPPPPPAAG